MFATLNRTFDNKLVSLGTFTVFNDKHNVILDLASIERPWLNNETYISCFPAGHYLCKKRYSKKHGLHWEITNVVNRTYILIHIANFVSDLQGCVAVGLAHEDINKDGALDVVSSTKAMNKLRAILPDEFKLIVK